MSSKYEQFQKLCTDYEKHPEQGLKNCKKRLQRDPKNLIYRLAQVWLLEKIQKEEQALELCSNFKPTTKEPWDPELISELQQLLAQCQSRLGIKTPTGGKTMIEFWTCALDRASRSQITQICEEMFKAGFRDEYWDIVQYLLKRLEKENPNLSQHHFSWIAATEIYAKKLALSDSKQSTLLNMIALRSLDNAVQQTKTGSAKGQKIASSKHLRLLTDVYRRQDQKLKLLDVFDSEEMGINSNVGKSDLEFNRVKIQLLLEGEMWQRLHDFCSGSLSTCFNYSRDQRKETAESAWADDWLVWGNFAASAPHLGNHAVAGSLKFVEEVLKKNPHSRNAKLAKFRLSKNLSEYVQHNISSTTFFDDFKAATSGSRSAYQSSREDRAQNMQGVKNQVAFTNYLKLFYYSNISGRSVSTRDMLAQREAFVKSLLNASTMINSEDILLLAVMTLLWCFRADHDMPSDREERPLDYKTSYLVQASCLVRTARQLHPQSYRATLLSSRLHQLLGLSSLSFSEFRDLRLKEVQWDSLGHLVYTRISTLHPFPAVDRVGSCLSAQYSDPMEGMQYALRWGPYAVKQLTSLISQDLQNLPFDKLQEFVEFKDNVEGSFTRALLHIECRRIARLRDEPLATDLPQRLLGRTSSDQHDFRAAPNFEAIGEEELEEALFLDTKPGKHWLAAMILRDAILTMMDAKLPNRELDELQDAGGYMEALTEQQCIEKFTVSEIRANKVWDILRRVTTWIYAGTDHKFASKDIKTDFAALTSAVQNYKLISRRCGPLPHWEYLHDRLTFLEVLKACNKLAEGTAEVAKKQKNHPIAKEAASGSLGKLRVAAQERFDGVQAEARKMKAELNIEWLEGLARRGDTGAALMRLDEIGAMAHVRWIFESAVDALDGVLKVKLKRS